MSADYPNEYSRILAYGPFAGCVDPWAEDDHYFNQIHGNMIAELLGQLNPVLIDMGYYASREASLQIAEYRKPDVSVELRPGVTKPRVLDYVAAATAIAVEPGIDVETLEPPLDAIYISQRDTLELVTVIEIVSPGNKDSLRQIDFYRDNRQRLYLNQDVNIVEIDLTRSTKRLTANQLTMAYPYHTAIYIPGDALRIVGFEFLTPLKNIAVPLRKEVAAADLQTAYNVAYRRAGIAVQLDAKHRYIERYIAAPSLLTDSQRQDCLERVKLWQEQLIALRKSSS